MTTNPSDISQEIYHRIYRLYKKNIDPKVIASTVALPIKAVQNIVSRFSHTYHSSAGGREHESSSYLDVMVQARGRYAVVDLSGSITGDQQELLEVELDKLLSLTFRAFALRMTDASALDKKGVETIQAFAEKARSRAVYVAILDPALAIEPVICELELDTKLPVFGTETVFEKNAFATAAERHHKK